MTPPPRHHPLPGRRCGSALSSSSTAAARKAVESVMRGRQLRGRFTDYSDDPPCGVGPGAAAGSGVGRVVAPPPLPPLLSCCGDRRRFDVAAECPL